MSNITPDAALTKLIDASGPDQRRAALKLPTDLDELLALLWKTCGDVCALRRQFSEVERTTDYTYDVHDDPMSGAKGCAEYLCCNVVPELSDKLAAVRGELVASGAETILEVKRAADDLAQALLWHVQLSKDWIGALWAVHPSAHPLPVPDERRWRDGMEREIVAVAKARTPTKANGIATLLSRVAAATPDPLDLTDDEYVLLSAYSKTHRPKMKLSLIQKAKAGDEAATVELDKQETAWRAIDFTLKHHAEQKASEAEYFPATTPATTDDLQHLRGWEKRINALLENGGVNKSANLIYRPCRFADGALIRTDAAYPGMTKLLRDTVATCDIFRLKLEQAGNDTDQETEQSEIARDELADAMQVLARRIGDVVEGIQRDRDKQTPAVAPGGAQANSLAPPTDFIKQGLNEWTAIQARRKFRGLGRLPTLNDLMEIQKAESEWELRWLFRSQRDVATLYFQIEKRKRELQTALDSDRAGKVSDAPNEHLLDELRQAAKWSDEMSVGERPAVPTGAVTMSGAYAWLDELQQALKVYSSTAALPTGPTPAPAGPTGTGTTDAVVGPRTGTTLAAGASGKTADEAQQAAEAWVKRYGFPGSIRALADVVKCHWSTMNKAVQASTYLKARKAEQDAANAGKVKSVADVSVNQATIEQATDEQDTPDVAAHKNDLIERIVKATPSVNPNTVRLELESRSESELETMLAAFDEHPDTGDAPRGRSTHRKNR